MVQIASNSAAFTMSPRGKYARSDDTRARILEAALAEASESGFHKASVARIAARAGVAGGVVNYQFGSKGELLRELMASLTKDLHTRLYLAIPADGGDFFDHERAGMLAYLEYLRANPSYLRLVEEVRWLEPDLYRRSVEVWVEQFVARVQGGIERGVMRAMDDQEIRAQGYFLLGTHLFLDRLMQADPYPGDEAVADAYLGLVRNGLGRTEPDTQEPRTRRAP